MIGDIGEIIIRNNRRPAAPGAAAAGGCRPRARRAAVRTPPSPASSTTCRGASRLGTDAVKVGARQASASTPRPRLAGSDFQSFHAPVHPDGSHYISNVNKPK